MTTEDLEQIKHLLTLWGGNARAYREVAEIKAPGVAIGYRSGYSDIDDLLERDTNVLLLAIDGTIDSIFDCAYDQWLILNDRYTKPESTRHVIINPRLPKPASEAYADLLLQAHKTFADLFNRRCARGAKTSRSVFEVRETTNT